MAVASARSLSCGKIEGVTGELKSSNARRLLGGQSHLNGTADTILPRAEYPVAHGSRKSPQLKPRFRRCGTRRVVLHTLAHHRLNRMRRQITPQKQLSDRNKCGDRALRR
jgi:hypothetical protein